MSFDKKENMKKITIAIDGHSSCGKSTMAKDLAREIGYIYIDSGAMYRAVTYYCLLHDLFTEDGVKLDELQASMSDIRINFRLNAEGRPETYLGDECIEKEIRGMAVSSRVSLIATIGFVREAMVALQQEMGKEKGIVMDGRDIGTVVLPDADVKIFLTADARARAQRRFLELEKKGIPTPFDEVLRDIEYRDAQDSSRAAAPLKAADDAVVLDNTNLSFDESVEAACRIIEEKADI